MDTDIRTLINILEAIARILTWIVGESGLMEENLQELFAATIDDTQGRISSVINRLRSIESREDPIFIELSEYGLTGSTLAMKVEVGRAVMSDLTNSVQQTGAGPTILGFKLKRPLKWINSILKSLAKVFPPLEAVAEYKEHVELAVKERESEPAWNNRQIFNLQ
jgi:hypothetical protein